MTLSLALYSNFFFVFSDFAGASVASLVFLPNIKNYITNIDTVVVQIPL
jgi:hypothetical protein